VRLLERREPGQNHVRVARRLVEIVVDADHTLEHRQRAVQARGVGRRNDRVSGDRDESLDLAGARRADLLGEAGEWKLPEHLGRPAHARAKASDFDPVRPLRIWQGVHAPRDRIAEHEPAGPIEVAGENRHDVDEPRRKRAELLGA
jgi:hypothetical protein